MINTKESQNGFIMAVRALIKNNGDRSKLKPLYSRVLDTKSDEEILAVIKKLKLNTKVLEQKNTEKAKQIENDSKYKYRKGIDVTDQKKGAIKRIARTKNINPNTIICNTYENITFGTRKEGLEFFKRQNFISIRVEKCFFEEGNMAWISKDEDSGKYYYFTKDPVTTKTVHFNMVELVGMLLHLTTDETIDYLLEECDVIIDETIKSEERVWLDMRKEINLKNIHHIERIATGRTNYVFLNKLIGKQLKVLSKLNEIGIDKLFDSEYSYEDKAVFFASTKYIASFLDISSSVVSQDINMFALLGLIEKIPAECVPAKLKEKAYTGIKGKHDITFFIINELNEETLMQCERKALEIKRKGLTPTNITSAKIAKAFGQDEADRIFGNTKKLQGFINQVKVNKKAEKEQIGNTQPIEEYDDLPF